MTRNYGPSRRSIAGVADKAFLSCAYVVQDTREVVHHGKKPEDIAVERFEVIAPLLDPGLDKATAVAMRKDISEIAGVSDRTIRRWLHAYGINGLTGLKPNTFGHPRTKAIPPDILEQALLLRRENPARSVKTIIHILEREGVVEPDKLKRSTLQDALAAAGYSSAQMRVYTQQKTSPYARRFACLHRNDSWQTDVKYGIYIKKKPTYLISFLDDATRFLVHSQFYFQQDLTCVLSALRSAVEKWGTPLRIHMDNGSAYRAKQFKNVLASLGIQASYCRPYAAQAKGKIERFNQTTEQFLGEVILKHPDTIEELNRYYSLWSNECYQKAPHSGIDGKLPEDTFMSDPTPLRYPDEKVLHDAFMYREKRKVDKSGCISFQGKLYAVEYGLQMVHRLVEVAYDPQDVSVLTVVCEQFPPCSATPLVITPHAAPKPRLPEPLVKAETSRLLDALDGQKAVETQQVRSVISFAKLGGEKGNV